MRLKLSIFPLVAVFLMSNTLAAQKDDTERLIKIEQELTDKLNTLRSTRNPKELEKRNTAFKTALNKALKNDGAFNHPFDSLKTISTLYAPDSSFRIFNWNIEYPDLSQQYECLILYKKNRRNNIVIELKDKSKELGHHYAGTGDADKWYGALYYDVTMSQQGRRKYYTLIGYDGVNARSNMKLLESMYFIRNDVRFGYPLFKMEHGYKKRFFLEYAESAYVSLKYRASEEKIIFDHLRPKSKNLEGFYEFYVPDMSYDAFIKQPNGKWKFKEDATPLNAQTKMDQYWENPTDEDAPIDNGTHDRVPTEKDKRKNKKAKRKKPRFKHLKNPKTYHNSKKSKIYH